MYMSDTNSDNVKSLPTKRGSSTQEQNPPVFRTQMRSIKYVTHSPTGMSFCQFSFYKAKAAAKRLNSAVSPAKLSQIFINYLLVLIGFREDLHLHKNLWYMSRNADKELQRSAMIP